MVRESIDAMRWSIETVRATISSDERQFFRRLPQLRCSAHRKILPGMRAETVCQKRSAFSHLAHEFLATATDHDSRIWRTLLALLFRPGLLSHEYMEGRRARWISPISLFLAVYVIYFVAPLHGSDVSLQFNSQAITIELNRCATTFVNHDRTVFHPSG